VVCLHATAARYAVPQVFAFLFAEYVARHAVVLSALQLLVARCAELLVALPRFFAFLLVPGYDLQPGFPGGNLSQGLPCSFTGVPPILFMAAAAGWPPLFFANWLGSLAALRWWLACAAVG
jgi:hypothetical protein